MPTAHGPEELRRRVGACADVVEPFDGVAFRTCVPQFATQRDLLSGVGAGRGGGRWNPPGLKTTYLSLSTGTAMAELRRAASSYGMSVALLLPQVLCSARIRLARVLDLTDGALRRRLRFSLRTMTHTSWRSASGEAATQRLGQVAFECGLEGLLVPSAADRTGTVLVVFPDALQDRSNLEIINADQLPH